MASLFAVGDHERGVDGRGRRPLIAFERTVPWRRIASYGTAAVLLAIGVLVLAAPSAVPGLTVPGSTPMQQMTPMHS